MCGARRPVTDLSNRHIYREIILPHFQATLHPIIINRLKPHIIVFKPDVRDSLWSRPCAL